MKELVKSPLGMDHYTFMRKFLNQEMEPHLTKLEDKKASEVERAQALDALNKKLKIELDALNAQLQAAQAAQDEALKALLKENIKKLNNVSDTVSSPDKKRKYDDALENPKSSTTIFIQDGSKKEISLLALFPLADIESAFKKFVDELKKAWPSSKGHFPEGNFKSELRKGPPEVLILTFPDAASAKAFISQLFDKNMAMFPGGSQDINDLDKQHAAQQQEEATIKPTQQNLKEKLAAVRQEAEEPKVSGAPKPSPFSSSKD